MKQDNREERLWRVCIGEENYEHELYVISRYEPILTEETVARKLRRLVGFTLQSDYIPEYPMFIVPRGQTGSVEAATEMFGFPVKELTTAQIVLKADNPEKKRLYQVGLFAKKVLTSFQKRYVLAHSKHDVEEVFSGWEEGYRTKIQHAKKMNCYPVVRVTEEEIVLDRSATQKLANQHRSARFFQGPPSQS